MLTALIVLGAIGLIYLMLKAMEVIRQKALSIQGYYLVIF